MPCSISTRSCIARIQFGFTISFHIVFPALTIGLASYLASSKRVALTRKEVFAISMRSG